jgi:hypothetical protein
MSSTCIPSSVVTNKYIVYFAELLPCSRSCVTGANEKASQPASHSKSVETAQAAGSQEESAKNGPFLGTFLESRPALLPHCFPNPPFRCLLRSPPIPHSPWATPELMWHRSNLVRLQPIVYAYLNFVSQFLLNCAKNPRLESSALTLARIAARCTVLPLLPPRQNLFSTWLGVPMT